VRADGYDFAHIAMRGPLCVRHLSGCCPSLWRGARRVCAHIKDIDDKINARALERRGTRNVPILDVVRELTSETGRIYDEDVAALGNLRRHARAATEHILRW